jgi:HD-GYP domain-containing protein (c-di-GMP phosphodiesterase class II)
METIRQERGKQFDPNLVDVFVDLRPPQDLGRLSDALICDLNLSTLPSGVEATVESIASSLK